MTGEARPNFRSKGSDRHVRRKARTWFKSCKVIFSLSNVGIEWIVPREYSPGRTVVLVLWKEPTPVNDSLRPYKKWKDQAKERRRWDQGCPMLHARRGLWLFPVQNISWTYTLTDLQRATVIASESSEDPYVLPLNLSIISGFYLTHSKHCESEQSFSVT